jgi:hypothetical protein
VGYLSPEITIFMPRLGSLILGPPAVSKARPYAENIRKELIVGVINKRKVTIKNGTDLFITNYNNIANHVYEFAAI